MEKTRGITGADSDSGHSPSNEKHVGDKHVSNLDQVPDPDAGLSAEERAKIVWHSTLQH